MEDELLELLLALDGVRQSPRYHPEGDALYHSLQAFELARRETDDHALWAAALLHDVGKAVGSEEHDATGADMLDGLVAPRIVWLVRHHLDLLHSPAATKRRLRAPVPCAFSLDGVASGPTPPRASHANALADLVRLRRWDVGGRSPTATVLSPERALTLLFDSAPEETLSPGGPAAYIDDLHQEEG